jgi:hypothetical protein
MKILGPFILKGTSFTLPTSHVHSTFFFWLNLQAFSQQSPKASMCTKQTKISIVFSLSVKKNYNFATWTRGGPSVSTYSQIICGADDLGRAGSVFWGDTMTRAELVWCCAWHLSPFIFSLFGRIYT